MPGLVVKEEIGFELAQEFAFGQAPQEHRFVDLDIPVHQGADRAFVRRCAARGYQRGTNTHGGRALLLQALQRGQQGFERPGQQRLRGFFGFVALERRQSMGLVDTFGLIAEQHRVAVESDPHFVWMGLAGMGRLWVDLRRRNAGLQGRAHVAQVRRQEQIGVQRFEVAPRWLAPREAAAFYRQSVVAGGAKHAHAGDRVVARQDHHVHRLRGALWRQAIGGYLNCIRLWQQVESQQLAHQRKSDAWLGRLVQAFQLQCHVGAVFMGAFSLVENRVLFLEIEQGARRNRHHQFALWRSAHDCCRNSR